MLTFIDQFLNRITMYRLVFWCLALLLAASLGFSALHVLSFSPLALVFSTALLVAVTLLTNTVFAAVFEAPENVESTPITAFILALIVTPVMPTDGLGVATLVWIGVWASASKFIFAYRKRHLFNPAALAVALTAFAIGGTASWWIGTTAMLPLSLALGFLIVRKVQREDLVLAFIGAAVVGVLATAAAGTPFTSTLGRVLLQTPLVFFATVMLTEPLTTPPTRWLRIAYGALVGLLFAPNIHIGGVYSTPELALLVGNVFSWVVSPKTRYLLTLKRAEVVGTNTVDFVFSPDVQPGFKPGQYLEWTLAHDNPDSRGNRRYFTVASSPTEDEVRLGVRFYPHPSSFKERLLALRPGDTIVASHRAGDFTLPRDPRRKLAFIAGGIGVTPFRSMLRYLSDRGERRDIALFYSNQTSDEVAYADVFADAERKLGIPTLYALTDPREQTAGERVYNGRITGEVITKALPDFRERTFYLSGPQGMVDAFDATLRALGVSKGRIKKDFFPGFA